MVGFQPRETVVQAVDQVAGVQLVMPDLGGDKNLAARNTAGSDAIAHFRLVAVHLGGINMAVAQGQGAFYGVPGFVAPEPEGSHADLRKCAE